MTIKSPYIFRILPGSLFILIFSILFVNTSYAQDEVDYEQIIFNYFVDSTLVSHDKLKEYCVYSSTDTYTVKYKTPLILGSCKKLYSLSDSFLDTIKTEGRGERGYKMKEAVNINVSGLCDTATTDRKKLKFKMFGQTHIENYVIVTIKLISKEDPYGYYLVYKLDKSANNNIELACFSRYYI